MKFFLKFVLLSAVVLGLGACEVQVPIASTKAVNNKTYNVEYLFEHEGCKVYRFRDEGHYVYFTNCKNVVVSQEKDSSQVRVVNMH